MNINSKKHDNSKADLNFLLESAEKSYKSGDLHIALQFLTKAINISPGMFHVYFTMAVIYKSLKNLHEAEKYYLTAINVNPSFAEAYYNLGILYHETTDYHKAVDCFSAASKINSNWNLAYYNLGNSLRELERYEEAIEAYSKSIQINPSHVSSYYNRGVVKEKLLKFDEALEDYRYAIRLSPDHVDSHWNSSLLLLAKTDYLNGFKEYEWRLKTRENVPRVFSRSRLTDQNPQSKRIFIYSEQGFGDALQFVRYVKLLKNKGCYTILECDPKLYKLFQNAEAIDYLYERKTLSEPGIDYDYYISIMSLPFYFGTTTGTIPAEEKYLSVSEEKIESWKNFMGNEPGRKIGLFWQGNAFNLKGKERSCPLKLFKEITELPGFTFYSLQVDDSNNAIADAGADIINLNEKGMTDFTDSAAVIENLDLVITIDSAVAHLAGALGKKTWLLLHYNPDWRWSGFPEESAWYPSIKLFRQTEKNNWLPVLEKVRNELAKLNL